MKWTSWVTLAGIVAIVGVVVYTSLLEGGVRCEVCIGFGGREACRAVDGTTEADTRHAAITNALDAGVPLRDAQILARHADPTTTEHYDRARGNLDRHAVHFLTAYVAGV